MLALNCIGHALHNEPLHWFRHAHVHPRMVPSPVTDSALFEQSVHRLHVRTQPKTGSRWWPASQVMHESDRLARGGHLEHAVLLSQRPRQLQLHPPPMVPETLEARLLQSAALQSLLHVD